jgi:hypothetical protein
MRRLFSVFLITLLAMRAMVGDAMAYEMAQAMTDAPAAQAQSAAPAISMPCHTEEGTDAGQNSQLACTTCQVCHMSAFLPMSLLSSALAEPSEMPSARSVAWLSADHDLVSKPPIL